MLGGDVCGGICPPEDGIYKALTTCSWRYRLSSSQQPSWDRTTFARNKTLVQSIIQSLNDHHALLFIRAGRDHRRCCGFGSCSYCCRPRPRQGDLGQRQDLPWRCSCVSYRSFPPKPAHTDVSLQNWFYLPANQVPATAGWLALNQDNGITRSMPVL